MKGHDFLYIQIDGYFKGSMSDPPEIPGLAHLCEHMLFFESPNPRSSNGFQSYAKLVSENGGSCNAFTTRDQTNYHFDIASAHFHIALKRYIYIQSRIVSRLTDVIKRLCSWFGLFQIC
jgi:predicted Zn-dependent peptidase